MFGLGKPRTKLGRFLDRNELEQGEIANKCGMNRVSFGRLCNDKTIEPHETTKIKIVGVLRRMGFDVSMNDFW